MELTRRLLKGLIEESDERNSEGKYSEKDVIGVSTAKKLIPTKAVLDGVNLNNYKLLPPGYFAFVADTSRRGDKMALAYNNTNRTYIVSTWYVVFYIAKNATKFILPEYLFMYFNRSEFDRYARINSWGSAREYFWLGDMENIELDLPSISIQQKYVDVYNAMLENQKSYERGLDDLKLVCDAYIENLSNCKQEKIGKYVERNKKKNQNVNFSKCDVKGFNNEGQFIEPMRLFSGDISTFKIISKDDLVYNSRINSTIKRLSIVINEGKNLIVSPAYESFKVVKEKELCPFYLYMLLQRESFARKVLFNSFGSSTIVFGFDDLCEIEIPVPSFSEQESIANMYRLYKERWNINEKLKEQIKDICPILIKGSIEEARQAKEA